jgi:hypothetical protein
MKILSSAKNEIVACDIGVGELGEPDSNLTGGAGLTRW